MKPINIDSIEKELREGRSQEAARRLQQMNTKHIPRALRLPLANLCRRAGLVAMGMRLLAPVVRADRPNAVEPATSAERVEYAALLQSRGVVREALEILERENPDAHHNILLMRAFCRIRNWEYDQAIPCLREFIAREESAYQRLVGEINLAASLIFTGELHEAYDLLSKAIGGDLAGNKLLAGSLELRGQIHFRNGDFARAEEDLTRAGALLGDANFEMLNIRKWLAVIKALVRKRTDGLEDLRAEALRLKRWEVVRDIDFHKLKIKFTAEAYRKLYFGSPYSLFRRRLEKEFSGIETGNAYVMGSQAAPWLDLRTGEFHNTKQPLKLEKQNLKLVDVLLRDFYRPVTAGEICAELFKGEYYNENSSPHRIGSALSRLRGFFRSHDLPLSVTGIKFYSIQIRGSLAIHVPLDRSPSEASDVFLARINRHFATRPFFEAGEACKVLEISRSKFLRLAQESNGLIKLGQGRAVKYKVA